MNRSTDDSMMTTVYCRHCFRRVPESDIQDDGCCRRCHQIAALFPNGERNQWLRDDFFASPRAMREVPELYSTEETPCSEKTLHVHYVLQGMHWYIAEMDPETGIAFGYTDLGTGCPEWGYVNLVELEGVRSIAGVVIRDLDFIPCTVGELERQ